MNTSPTLRSARAQSVHGRTRFQRLALRLLALPLLAVAALAQAPAQTSTQRPAQAPAARTVTGTVQDPTGAIISGARVRLQRASGNGSIVASATSDGGGKFQLAQPAAGDYTLTVALDGFSPLSRSLHIANTPLQPLVLTLQLGSVSSTVTVNADEDVALTDPASNQDATTVSADDMKSLPIFDADIVATLSAFLDAGAAGEGGTTLVVDGVETATVGVSPSAIARVSVNQDPYSAQYRNPGRGQVEIVTKAAADHYHGEFSFTFRDSALNARNYFAASNPPSQRRIYEGFLTGPVAHSRNTAFLFSLTRREAYNIAQVDATALPTTPASVNAPQLSTNLTMKVSHQFSDNHQAYLLYRLNRASMVNQNVGGQTLESAGYNSYTFDMDIAYHDDLSLGPNKFNQFFLRFERNYDRTVDNNEVPQIVVEGVATFGSAQQTQLNSENNPALSDIFDWTLKTRIAQELKFGIQIPNLGRRILDDSTERQGTYTFANLAAYVAGQPSSYTVQQGLSRFQTLYAQPGAFFMDQIQLTPRLTVIPGVRYDFQDAVPQTRDAIEPHLSLAYVIDKDHGFVIRTGSAAYVRRVGVNVGQQWERYHNAAERSLLNTSNPCYPIGPACNPATGQAPSLFDYAPGVKSPVQTYFGLSVERNLNKQSTVTLGYNGYRGWHALRSIDVNAPLPPFTSSARPDPNYAQVLHLDSGGYQKTDGMSLSYRGRISNVFSGLLQYTWQHADADTQWSTFNPQNQYAPNNEWSRTDLDQRQRLSLFGTLYPDKPLTLGIGFYANSPLPYTITTGTDDYRTGFFNARPAGVPRNSVNGGSYRDLQVRLGYTWKLHPLYNPSEGKDHPQDIAFSLSSFNTLNTPSFESYDGVLGSPDFRRPTTANNGRRLQMAVSYDF